MALGRAHVDKLEAGAVGAGVVDANAWKRLFCLLFRDLVLRVKGLVFVSFLSVDTRRKTEIAQIIQFVECYCKTKTTTNRCGTWSLLIFRFASLPKSSSFMSQSPMSVPAKILSMPSEKVSYVLALGPESVEQHVAKPSQT